jgi:hypothetical protein
MPALVKRFRSGIVDTHFLARQVQRVGPGKDSKSLVCDRAACWLVALVATCGNPTLVALLDSVDRHPRTSVGVRREKPAIGAPRREKSVCASHARVASGAPPVNLQAAQHCRRLKGHGSPVARRCCIRPGCPSAGHVRRPGRPPLAPQLRVAGGNGGGRSKVARHKVVIVTDGRVELPQWGTPSRRHVDGRRQHPTLLPHPWEQPSEAAARRGALVRNGSWMKMRSAWCDTTRRDRKSSGAEQQRVHLAREVFGTSRQSVSRARRGALCVVVGLDERQSGRARYLHAVVERITPIRPQRHRAWWRRGGAGGEHEPVGGCLCVAVATCMFRAWCVSSHTDQHTLRLTQHSVCITWPQPRQMCPLHCPFASLGHVGRREHATTARGEDQASACVSQRGGTCMSRQSTSEQQVPTHLSRRASCLDSSADSAALSSRAADQYV